MAERKECWVVFAPIIDEFEFLGSMPLRAALTEDQAWRDCNFSDEHIARQMGYRCVRMVEAE